MLRMRSATLVVLSTALVVGCSSDDPRELGSDATSAPSRASTQSTVAEPQTLPPGVPDTYREDMQAMAQGYGITEPPDVTPIRAVNNREQAQVMAECMTAKGFTTVVGSDGRSWVTSAERVQADAMRLAEYQCIGEYPLAAQFAQKFDERQLQVHYDWMRHEVVPCMQGLGYPTPEIPSLETVTSNYAAGGPLWFPDTELDPATIADDMAVIMEECEIFPPNDLLYGPPSQ